MKNIFLDEAGRMKDDKGNIINLKPKAVSVLKVNINRQKEERVKAMLRHQKGTSMASKERKFFDQNLLTTSLVKFSKEFYLTFDLFVAKMREKKKLMLFILSKKEV